MDDLMSVGGFGITWNDVRVYSCEGFRPRMKGYHFHSYYEISLLESGNMTVFFSDMRTDREEDARAVLMKPFVPHFITPRDGVFYRHTNVEFSPTLLDGMPEEFRTLLLAFGANGTVVRIGEDTCKALVSLAEKIKTAKNVTEKKILLLYFLSVLNENKIEDEGKTAPVYIADAMRYLSDHFAEKIKAEKIAERLGIGRTTLMVNFKRYTNSTVGEYLTRCRISHAIGRLHSGCSEEETAFACGFGSVSNMIHAFRRFYGMTPMAVLRDIRNES